MASSLPICAYLPLVSAIFRVSEKQPVGKVCLKLFSLRGITIEMRLGFGTGSNIISILEA